MCRTPTREHEPESFRRGRSPKDDNCRMTRSSHRQRCRLLGYAAPLLATSVLLSGCSVGLGQSDPSSTEDADPGSFRPLYDQVLAALAEPSGSELPALRKLLPKESTDLLQKAVDLCGDIDPSARQLHLLNSPDPYHIMSGRLTGRKRNSTAETGCGLALMWVASSTPTGGRHWEIQAWSLDAKGSPAPTSSD